MPTNRSTPQWCCDICGHNFGTARARAVACEAAGRPEELPVGSLVLVRDYSGFHLAPITDILGVFASSGEPGHYVDYRVAGIESRVGSRLLSPHRPDKLNRRQHLGTSDSSQYRSSAPAEMMAPITAMAISLGLATDADICEHWTHEGLMPGSMIGPIPGVMLTAFDALDLEPKPFSFDGRSAWRWWRAACSLAMEATGGHSHAASAWLLRTSAAQITATLKDRLERWWAGESVTCPLPDFHYRSALAPSKLTKPQRSAVAATNVEWRARTNQIDFANECFETLGVKVEEINRLFAPQTVAVCGGKGGVGKTTVAGALAVAAAKQGRRVVIVDLDLANPNQTVLWGLQHVDVDPGRKVILPSAVGVEGVRAFSLGQALDEGEPLGWGQATMKHWIEFVAGALDLGDTDLVVLDLPPGRSPVLDLLLDWGTPQVEDWIHVTTGHPMSLDASRRLLASLAHYVDRKSPRPGHLVENLSRRVVSVGDVTGEARIAGEEGDVKGLAAEFALDWAGSLPWAANHVELAASPELENLAAALTGAART